MTKDIIDFGEYQEQDELNKSDVLGKITILAEEMQDYDSQIAEAELQVKRLKERRRKIAEDDLPELFHEVGMTTLSTRNGLPLKLEKVLRTSIAKGRKVGAIKWLDDNGHGGIVKRNVIVSFDKTKEDKVQNLLNLIGKGWPNNKIERDVNAATCKALIKRLLEEGQEVPKETFGIHQVDEVKISSK